MTKVKVVFEDKGQTKVIKGEILNEDDYTYKIATINNDTVVIGKKYIVSITEVKE